jgi:hypothetical protein
MSALEIWNTTPAYTVPTPTSVLGSGSQPADLKWRFPADDLAAPIAKDNLAEDELLTDYISRCRMAFHFDSCRNLAGDAVEEAKKAAAEKEAARLEAVRGLVDRAPGRGLVGSLELDDDLYGEYDDEQYGEEEGDGEEVLTQEHLDAIAEGEGEGMELDDEDRYGEGDE